MHNQNSKRDSVPPIPVAQPSTPAQAESIIQPAAKFIQQNIGQEDHTNSESRNGLSKILSANSARLLLLIGLAILCFTILANFFIFSSTDIVKESGDLIVTQLAEGNVQLIYSDSLLSLEISESEFRGLLGRGTKFDMTQATFIRWLGRGRKNHQYYIYGQFEFETGGKQIVTFWFLKDEFNQLKLMGISGGEPELL